MAEMTCGTMVSGFQVKEVEVENANTWGEKMEKKPKHLRTHMKEDCAV